MTASDAYNTAIQGYQTAIGQLGQQGAATNKAYDALYAQQAQYGASQKLALNQQYQQALAQNQQSALSAGLGNTTVLQAGARGINYDYGNSLLTLNDQLLNRQNAIKQAQLGYQGQYQQNLSQLGAAQAGFLGGYAQQAQGIQAQYGLQGLIGSQQLQQQQVAQLGQLQAAQTSAALGQLSQGQQFQQQLGLGGQQYGYQAALNNQQAANQSALSAQQAQQQMAMQQAQFAESNYAQEQYGYY